MSCNNSCSEISTTFPTGAVGPQGATGVTGGYGGFASNWLFDVTNGGAPADTFLRFNGAGVTANVTTITVAQLNGNSQDLTSFLASLSNNNQFGYIRIFKTTDSTKFWYGEITNVLDSGTYFTLTATYIGASDAATVNVFTASTPIVLSFAPSGETTPSVIVNNTTETTTNAPGYTNLISGIIPANKIKTNGDVFEIDCSFKEATVGFASWQGYIQVNIGGSTCHTVVPELIMVGKESYMIVHIKATRESSISLFIEFKIKKSNSSAIDTAGWTFVERGFAVTDLSTTPLTIQVLGRTDDTDKTIKQENLLITYYSK